MTISNALEIDGIRFTFDDSWLVAKWDASKWYQDGIYKLNGTLEKRNEGTKAVDIFGIRGEVAYLFEVKDFRGFDLENKHRQESELPLEVGLKTRDTLAGLVGAVASGKGDGLPNDWLRLAQRASRGDGKRPNWVHVFALLAEDDVRRGEPQTVRNGRSKARSDNLKRCLAWLTPKVLVRDPLREAEALRTDYGITTESLPGAGPARPR